MNNVSNVPNVQMVDIKNENKKVDIPSFLSPYTKNEFKGSDANNLASEFQKDLNDSIEKAEYERNNHYHLKELDKQADAFSEDEAKVIIKRLVSNYPDIVLDEVSSLIKDMQELSMVILKNSREFANKRGDI